MSHTDMLVREHERGKIKISENGKTPDVIARVIAKLNIQDEVLEKVEDLRNPEQLREM